MVYQCLGPWDETKMINRQAWSLPTPSLQVSEGYRRRHRQLHASVIKPMMGEHWGLQASPGGIEPGIGGG